MKFIVKPTIFSFFLSISFFVTPKKIFSQESDKKITRILFIFDGSNSMNAQWQNQSKIAVAKKLMFETVDQLEQIPNVELALRMYGHQTKIRPGQQDCSDTKLEVPFAKYNHDRIKSKIKGLEPQGTTPIARSLEYSAEDFPECTNCNNVIILITDGIEACDEDPCAVARALRKKGIEVRPFVIGIALDLESLLKFQCIGKYYDASTEETFKSVLKVVLSEALNNTTVQVNLFDSKDKIKETNVPMTFFDEKTGKPVYHFIHTMDKYGIPDTLSINPLTTYKLVVYTTPQRIKEGIKIKPGEHNQIDLKTPQGSLELRLNGAYFSYTDIKCIVREKDKMPTLNAQKWNSKDDYIVGNYDLEIMTLPRIYMQDVKIEQSKTTKIEIAQPGMLDLSTGVFGFGAIYIDDNNKEEWVCNLEEEKTRHQINLQPGKYKLVFRSDNAKTSAYTVEKTFEIVQATITNLSL